MKIRIEKAEDVKVGDVLMPVGASCIHLCVDWLRFDNGYRESKRNVGADLLQALIDSGAVWVEREVADKPVVFDAVVEQSSFPFGSRCGALRYEHFQTKWAGHFPWLEHLVGKRVKVTVEEIK